MTSTTLWIGLASLGIAVLALIVEFIRARNEHDAGFNILAFFASLGTAVFIFLWQRNAWIALIASGLVYEALGTRWARVVRLNNPVGRILYFLLFDAAVYFLFYASWWQWWHKGFLTVLVTLGGRFLEMMILPYLLRIFFPVIARQELAAVMRQGNMADQAVPLERDADQILRERKRKQILRRLNQHQHLLARAQKLYGSRKHNQAFKLADQVIAELTAVSNLTAPQQKVLGGAYLLRGKIRQANRLPDAAVQDFTRARQWVTLDEEALGGLAMRAVKNNDRSEEALKVCLDFLRARRNMPPNDAVNQVMMYLQKGCEILPGYTQAQIRAAQTVAKQTLEVLPSFPPAHLALGQAAVLLGDWENAQAPLEAARKGNPKDARVHALLGQVHAQFNRYPEAVAELSEALRLDEKQPATIPYLLGSIHLRHTPSGKAESLKEAVRWLKLAVSLAPGMTAYRANLAQAYAQAGEKTAAREEAAAALKLDPNQVEANLLMADLLYEQEHWGEAAGYYERVHLIQPANPAPALRLGLCLMAQQKMSEAEAVLEPIASMEPAALLPLGRARLAQHKHDEAEAALRESIRIAGAIPETWYWLGCVLAWKAAASSKPNYDAAREALTLAGTANDGWKGRACLQMGHIALRSQDLESADQHYREAEAFPATRLEAGLARARLHLANGRLEDAQQALNSLVREGSTSQAMWELRGVVAELQSDLQTAGEAYRKAGNPGALGVVLYLQDRTDEAETALQQALQRGDRSDRVLYTAGWIAIQQNDYQKGIKLWTELHQRHPDDDRLGLNLARAWYLAGMEHFRKGEYLQAAQAWEHYYALYASDDDLRAALRQTTLLAARQAMGSPGAVALVERTRALGSPAEEADLWEGLAHLSALDGGNAVAPLERLDNAGQQDGLAAYHYGLALLQTGKHARAKAKLEQALSQTNGDRRRPILLALAMCQAAQADWQGAARGLDEITQPYSPEETALVVTVRVKQGRLEEARRLAHETRSIPAMLMVGAACATAGSIPEAQAAYRDVLALDGQNPQARSGLAGILLNMAARAAKDEKWSQSRACLQEAISLDSGSPELSRFLEAVESAEITGGGTISGEDAIEKLESLLARNPEHPRADLLHQLAMLYHREAITLESSGSHSKKRDEYWTRALAYWAVVIEEDTYWTRWLATRKTIYEQEIPVDELEKLRYESIRSRVREVHQQYAAAHSAEKQNKDAARHRRWMAQWHLEVNAAHAMKQVIEELQKKGKPVSFGIPSGPMYWKLTNKETEVRQAAETALKIAPEPAQALLEALSLVGMARSLLKEAQLEEAIELLQTHLEKNPNDRSARELIQQALLDQVKTLATSDLRGAITAFQRLQAHGGKTAEAEKIIVAETLADVNKLLEDGKRREAENRLGMALQILPNSKPLKNKQNELMISQHAEKVSKAVERINLALKKYESGALNYQQILAEFNASQKELEEARRALPHEPKIQQHLRDLAGLRGDVINLEAVKIANSSTEIARYDRNAAITGLQTAERMLVEANHYAPNNAQIQKNLAEVRSALRTIRGY